MNRPAGKPFTSHEISRAKRAQEVMWALLSQGAPAGSWVAIRLEDGRTQGAAYPSKAVAIAHVHDPSMYAFGSIPLDGIVSWHELAAFLRFAERRENYWAAQDPEKHIVIPRHGILNSGPDGATALRNG